MASSVIVSAGRTAIGKFGGAVSTVPAVELGAHAIRGALERGGLSGEHIDYVIMGQVLQAGTGQITAPQAAVGAGGPGKIPAEKIKKGFPSGAQPLPPPP